MRGKQALKNVGSNILLQIVTAVSGLLLPRLYLMVYGSAMNGMVSSVTQFMSYLMLLEAGIGAAAMVSLYEPLAYNDVDKINGILAAAKKFYYQTGIVYAAMVGGLALIYPYLLNGQISIHITQGIVIILSLSNLIDYLFLGKYRVLLNADQHGYIVIGAQTIGTILNMGISIVMIQAHFSIIFVKLVATFVYILRSIFIFVYIKKHYPYLDFNVVPIEGSFSQRWAALVHQISTVVLNNTNLIILTLLGGARSLLEISVYTIHQMVSNMILLVISSFSNALAPGFGELISKKETDTLEKAFSEYEFFFQILLFLLYVCMGVLFIPFISLYTEGVSDVNYIRPGVALLFTLIGAIQNIRTPHITLICAAGHYRQTQRRALLEAGINITLSTFLISRYGLTGVLTGTLIAFIYSACHIFWYCNKCILKNSIKRTMARLGRNAALSVICIGIAWSTNIFHYAANSYVMWITCAVIFGIISAVIIILGNSLAEPAEIKSILKRIKGIIDSINKTKRKGKYDI